MKIDVKALCNTTEGVGRIYWICDYRRPDLSKKPIRHIPPTQVIVVDNETTKKRFNYSEIHFAKLTAKGLASSTTYPVYDTTGYRSYPGVPLEAFETKEECVKRYNELADVIIDAIDEQLKHAVDNLNAQKQSILLDKANALSL